MAEQQGIKEDMTKEIREEETDKGNQTPKKQKKIEKKDEKSAKEKETEKKLKEMEDTLAEVNDKYIRLAAEFDNYRRRTSKERLELAKSAGEDVIKGILPVLDDCERALEVLGKSGSNEAAIEGTELIFNKLKTFLEGKGLTLIEAVGKPLDTDFHEAVAQIPVDDNDKKNKIVEVVRQGYMLNEKVIRFAKVVVGI